MTPRHPDREGLQVAGAVLLSEGGNERRIDSAGEKTAERDVGDKAISDGF